MMLPGLQYHVSCPCWLGLSKVVCHAMPLQPICHALATNNISNWHVLKMFLLSTKTAVSCIEPDVATTDLALATCRIIGYAAGSGGPGHLTRNN